ncbi:hypothetical protein CfE428DRAFT_5793 [Chthoniobacter flavus Ellin428]|uniref:Uncharacterized protein n=1 Tax=Chthoniobacter flavus Ellin428 TaxID=497964 RepID=B4DA53_9BACT|nr:hypothetical protein [Chthoniobacter flavus]EDY16680.1 hypothetical protein CfE428DRAFT_5793 [Chthoniobacter flavus Ellin428]TCO87253.1 hypothetical protein EV701_12390 [Chthoniobacter flavus]
MSDDLTPQDIEDLKAFGSEISTAANAPHEPRCIARAFASPLETDLRFTMQVWIDLEAIQSPILRGEAFEDAAQIEHAARAFAMDLRPTTVTPKEAAACLDAMRDAIADAFELSLKMSRPGESQTGDSDGFGTWLPIYACLVTQCRIDPEAALRMDVGRAFALISAFRHNDGYRVAGGTPYALRDVASETLNSQPSTLN